jgi:C-terminal processing protease CtpA/Prc
MIDTGASHSLLLDTRSDELIECPDPNLETTLGRGLAGTIHGQVARVDRLKFEKFDFNGVIATFPYKDSYDVDYSDNQRHGTFGGGMMSRFKTIYNYADGKLYLKKGRQYKKPFEFNLSGVIVKATGVYLREYEIDDMRENSAAAKAGLMVGDTITHINGIAVDKLTLDEVIGRLNVKENKRVRVYVRRQGERMIFNFRLKRLI